MVKKTMKSSWRDKTYIGLLSILLADWQSSWKEIDEGADEVVDEETGGYDNRSLLSLGWMNLNVNKWW